MSNKLLDVKNLCVDYVTENDVVRAVNEVSFSIDKGEIFGLAGESGCGKSTVAFAIARLTQLPGIITGGDIWFDGENILDYNKDRLRSYRWAEVSVVFQSAMNSLNPVIPISEQLCDVMQAHQKVKLSEARERAGGLLELVGISAQRLDDFPHQFSGGMRQRIGIALALALNPKLIIMDEPTTALDVVVQRDIMQEIYELKEKFGFSILFITHDLSLMVEFSDRIGVMYAGTMVEVAPSKVVLDAPTHPYTAALGSCFPPLTGPRVRLEGIPGNPLDLSKVPKGCRFQDRCSEAFDVCSQSEPLLQQLGPGHQSACHLNECTQNVVNI